MFDTIAGLPVHILVIHAVVAFAPLAALLAIGYAVRPAWRRVLRWPVVHLRASGADVLLATPTDTRDAGLFKALRGRHAIHTANLFTIAQRHGCSVLNLWGMASIRDWRMWGEDRIHLNTEGHTRVAQAALVALGLRPSTPDSATRRCRLA